jgi:MinD-like ATPase involved in chromosome partitioning or flagellar assembly
MIRMDEKEPKVIFFSGSKGGCGCSFITYCVSTYLAGKTTGNVLLIDLNTGKKDSRLIFNLADGDYRDLGDIESVIDEIDISILKRLVINFKNGLNLILPPLKTERNKFFNNEYLEKLIDVLKEHFDLICVDFPAYLYNHYKVDMKDLVDKYVFISLPDLVSLNNLNLMIKDAACDEFSYECDIIINKFNTRPSVPIAGINSILKNPVNAFIPYDRDIEFLIQTRGPGSVFDYNLRVVNSISAFSKKICEDFGL